MKEAYMDITMRALIQFDDDIEPQDISEQFFFLVECMSDKVTIPDDGVDVQEVVFWNAKNGRREDYTGGCKVSGKRGPNKVCDCIRKEWEKWVERKE